MAAVAVLVVVAPTASALTIVRNFTGGSTPGNAVGGGTLQSVFNVAADCWERAILDTHTVTINYGWGALTGGTLGVHSLVSQGGSPHRETAGNITFDNDGTSNFFMDSTPLNPSEWSTLTTSSANLGGGIVNTGRVFSGAAGLAFGNFDLWSIALHEIGHALGMSSANTAFQAENGDLDIDVQAPRPFPGTVIPTVSGAHINVGSALMFPSFGSGSRKLITDIDILANAEISEFNNLDFTPHGVPEPASMAVLGLGLAALLRKRRK